MVKTLWVDVRWHCRYLFLNCVDRVVAWRLEQLRRKVSDG